MDLLSFSCMEWDEVKKVLFVRRNRMPVVGSVFFCLDFNLCFDGNGKIRDGVCCSDARSQ